MAENAVIRRFFRRENDELTMHEETFGAHTALVAFHILAGVLADDEFEIEEVTNFEETFSDVERVSVCWSSCTVGYGEKREYITAGYVLGRHRGFSDMKMVVSVVPDGCKVALRLLIRSEDSSRLCDVLDWIVRLKDDGHPLRGRLFSLGPKRFDFLPPQGVERCGLDLLFMSSYWYADALRAGELPNLTVNSVNILLILLLMLLRLLYNF